MNTPGKSEEADRLWSGCVDTVRQQLSDATWRTTFSGIKAVDFDAGDLVLVVPSSVQRDRIQSRYLGLLQEAVEAASPGVSVRVEVDTDWEEVAFDLPAADLGLAPANGAVECAQVAGLPAHNGSERFTFEHFVVGPSNRFAHAAALSVAEGPATSYNPLFIHGASGLGKTHLLRGIAYYIASHYPELRVRYVTTETFLNEFIESIQSNSRAHFKRRYRDNDVLLIDDIQFMEGKEETQNEFFHTFNELHQNNKQLVLTSDRPPDAIATLQDRLRSRFKGGLITDVHPPDIETRLAILRNKAASLLKKPAFENAVLPDDVLEFIADNIKDSIRELEGALTKITAYSSLTGRPIDLDLASFVLSDLITKSLKPPVTADRVIDATSELFGFERAQIVGPSRIRPLVQARQVAMYVTRDLTQLSYPEIGRAFGDRDHTTVMHACRKIEDRMGDRQQIYDQVTTLTQRLNGA